MKKKNFAMKFDPIRLSAYANEALNMQMDRGEMTQSGRLRFECVQQVREPVPLTNNGR